MAATNKTRAMVHDQERDRLARDDRQATPGPQSSFKMTLNRIASLAQQSIRQSQEKSSMGYQGTNDSLDYMKLDFLNQFNQLGLTEKASAEKSIGR